MSHRIMRPWIPPQIDLVELAKAEPRSAQPNSETGGKSAEVENKGGKPSAVKVNSAIDRKDYIQVEGVLDADGNPVLISKYEISGANNKNYEDTQRFVLEKGLYVPSTAIFMPHFSNVVKAFNRRGKLFDGAGDELDRKEVKDIYKHLTTNHIAVYGKGTNAGAWTWLNGQFIKGTGFGNLDLEIILELDKNGGFVKHSKKLQEYLKGNGVYADFVWNSQGLPSVLSKTQSYEQGRNIRYWEPVEGRVARFNASSDGANLDCNRDPGDCDSSLGVFASTSAEVRSDAGNSGVAARNAASTTKSEIQGLRDNSGGGK